jgi:hypothetical protein
MACTLAALAWANSPAAGSYFALARTKIGISWGELEHDGGAIEDDELSLRWTRVAGAALAQEQDGPFGEGRVSGN